MKDYNQKAKDRGLKRLMMTLDIENENDKNNNQYKKSFDSICLSCRKIAKDPLNLKML